MADRTTTTVDTAMDAAIAARVAEAVGATLLAARTSGLVGRELAAHGDAAAQDTAARLLAELAPADPVRSEEGAAPARRDGRLWVVDPLDGTREFTEAPRDDWAVHVALVEHGAPTVGAVALPARGELHRSDDVPPVPDPVGPPIRIVVSRSRPPRVATLLADAVGADLVPMGSAGAKTMAVVRGEADAYVHAGGQYEWDSAAPVAVAVAAGLHTSRLDGRPLEYGRENPWLPDLLVCRPGLAASILRFVRDAA